MRSVLACALLCLLLGVNTVCGSAVDLVDQSSSEDGTPVITTPFHVEATGSSDDAVFKCLTQGQWKDFSGGMVYNRQAAGSTIQCVLSVKQGRSVTVTVKNLVASTAVSMPWYASETANPPSKSTPSTVTKISAYSTFAGSIDDKVTADFYDGRNPSTVFYFSFPSPSNLLRWEVSLSTTWTKKTTFVWKSLPTPCSLSCYSGVVEVPYLACDVYSGAKTVGCLNGGSCPDLLFGGANKHTCTCPSGWTGSNCGTSVLGTWNLDTSKAVCIGKCGVPSTWINYDYKCTSAGAVIPDSHCLATKPSPKQSPTCNPACTVKIGGKSTATGPSNSSSASTGPSNSTSTLPATGATVFVVSSASSSLPSMWIMMALATALFLAA